MNPGSAKSWTRVFYCGAIVLTGARSLIYSVKPMALLKESADAKRFDTRVVERNLERGQVAYKEVDENVKSLKDDSANVYTVTYADLEKQEAISRSARQRAAAAAAATAAANASANHSAAGSMDDNMDDTSFTRH